MNAARSWILILTALSIAGPSRIFPQEPGGAPASSIGKTFPLRVDIRSSVGSDLSGISQEMQSKAAAMGMALPYFVVFRGDIDGENHWLFSCRKENTMRESIPCAPVPAGMYYGRWIFDHSMIQIVNNSSQDPITRFLTASTDPKNPPSKDDPVLQETPYDFPVRFPKGKSISDYAGLVHVYGGVSLELPAGQLPARGNCNIYTWSTYQTSVNCTSSPPVEIHRGYVTLDISTAEDPFASLHCEAKWRWSHCAVLDPGLYYARIEGRRLILLTHRQDGKPEEIGFEVSAPKAGVQSPVK